MKVLNFLGATLVAGVVGVSASVPDSIPVGESFPPENTEINLVIGSYDEYEILTDSYAHTNFVYSPEMGDLENATRTALAQLTERFVPQPGTEAYDHAVGVHIGNTIGDVSFPIGGDRNNHYFKLVKVNGTWKAPQEALKVAIGYQSYIGAYTPDLTSVELLRTNGDGAEYTEHEVSPNGVTDVTCSEYPGGVAYAGPDVLKIPIGLAYPDYYVREYPGFTPKRGLYTLRFVGDIWANYDLTTGLKTASNEPEPKGPEVKPEIKEIRVELLQNSPFIVKLASPGTRPWGVMIKIVGDPGFTGVLEWSDAVTGKQWHRLADIEISYNREAIQADEFAKDTSTRFYRVR